MAIFSYRYFLLGSSHIVRVTYDACGLKIGAEHPDDKTGEMIICNTLLSRLELNWDVEEISVEQFKQLRRGACEPNG